MEDFRGIVKEWLELEETIKSLQTQVKEKKTRLTKLSEYIITFMNSENKQVCNIGEYGSLVLKTRNSCTGLKKEQILEALMKLTENEDIAKQHLNDLYDKRQQKSKTVLKLSTT